MKIVSAVIALMTVASTSFAQTNYRDITADVTRVACFSVFEGRSTERVSGSKLNPTDPLKLAVQYKDRSGNLKMSVVTVTSADYVNNDKTDAIVIEAGGKNAVANIYIDLNDLSAELKVNGVAQDYLKLVCQFDLN